MIEPRRLPADTISAALEKALRYRLLNEPHEAESICRDVLAVEPGNQDALVTLLLALTDQFGTEFGTAMAAAKEIVPQLQGEYEQAYYQGIIFERWGKAQLAQGTPTEHATGWIREAMRWYDSAAQLSKPDDPDAVLRWNTCARFLARYESVASSEAHAAHESSTHDVVGEYGDDVPLR